MLCPKKVVFFSFLPFLHNGSEDLAILLHECRRQYRAHRWSQMLSLKMLLILYYRGLTVEKRSFLTFFGLFSKWLKQSSQIFCMIVEDNGAYHLSYISFLKKNILDYRGLSVRLLRFLAFSPKQL